MSKNSQKKLQNLRKNLLRQDEKLLQILQKRMKIAEEIGILKAKNQWQIEQENFWQEGSLFRNKIALELDLNPDFIENIFQEIHLESKKIQANSSPLDEQ